MALSPGEATATAWAHAPAPPVVAVVPKLADSSCAVFANQLLNVVLSTGHVSRCPSISKQTNAS